MTQLPTPEPSDAGSPSALDRFALRLADLSIRHPWPVLLTSLLIVFAAASGGRFLKFSNNYRVFFSSDNPELMAYEEFQATYTKNDNILFVLRPADGRVFTPEMAAAVEWLTEEAWQIPYTLRVDSVTNFQHSWAEGDDLTVENLIRDAPDLTPAMIAERGSIAMAEPLLSGRLVSRTGQATGVNVTLQYPEESLAEVPEAVAFARDSGLGAR